MDTKLKKLITNNYKIKIVSLFLLFLSISILFEVCFNLVYSFRGESVGLYLDFYLFGKASRYSVETIFNHQFDTAIITFSLAIISFMIYRSNININIKLFNSISKFMSKLSLDIIFITLCLILYIRLIFWSHNPSLYDNELILCNFIILWVIYFTYKSLLLDNKSFKERIFINKLIVNLLNIQNNNPLYKKLFTTFTIAIIVQFISIVVANFIDSDYIFMSLFVTCIISLFYFYICNILATKINYIEYLSETIKDIENGNLECKLDIIGNDELSSIATSINNLTYGFESALEEKLKSEKMKTELITNVSHDLKTPLTSIVSYIDILNNNKLDEQTTKDYLNILDKKATRLKSLVEDIFEASKITSGDIDLNIIKTDIKELLIQSIVELEDKIESSKLDFIINTPDSPIFTNIDGKKIFRVFENLIINITKYSIPNTRVYIDIIIIDDNVLITMKNISNHMLNITSDKLLERFVRGDISRNTDGSGLGLSISKNLVELQNGTFDLDIDGDLFKIIIKFKVIE